MQLNTATAQADTQNINPYTEARNELTNIIRLELVGPDNDKEKDNPALLNEVLSVERPLQRYKAGILYPKPENADDSEDLEKDAATVDLPKPEEKAEEAEKILTKKAEESIKAIQSRHIPDDSENDSEGEAVSDLAYSGLQRPASMAVSFFIPDSSAGTQAAFLFSGGIYKYTKEGQNWVRSPILLIAEKDVKSLLGASGIVELEPTGDAAPLLIRLKLFVRRYPQGVLITYSAINETPKSAGGENLKNEARCAYQSMLKVKIMSADGKPAAGISAYPAAIQNKHDQEEVSLALLYRHFETFAIGHGCSASWQKEQEEKTVDSIWSTAFPEYETFSITPELKREDGSLISVSMRDLAAIGNEKQGLAAIDELIRRYDDWIKAKEAEIPSLPAEYRKAAEQNLTNCREALGRIKEGRAFIEENGNARKAFRLANKAILLQQKRFSDKRRDLKVDEAAKRIFFEEPFQSTAAVLDKELPNKGKWRPFQIAFLLLSLKSAALGDARDREDVDLIWFPTGGGKTEAYFGLTAFSIFYRRLENPDDAGVSVLMRYTLRLLTADQFERASGLICALEHIRREEPAALGSEPFSIGIWLGQSTTPNLREEARKVLRELTSPKGANKFLVTKCPWCSAQIGPVRTGKWPEVHGYKLEAGRVKICCSDPACDFHGELPIYVVDEDIYEFRPTLIIGTVDKFAQIAWDENCRYIFGLDDAGEREVSPPGLIIQDELHLISGPLGSMVGLYETLIEDFCTDYRAETPVKPKIICSTATIRRFETQIRSLYGRTKANLFPAQGLEASDSFFAKWQDHKEQRGRKYIGIYAPGESIQTMQVRTLSIALQGARNLPDPVKDPWWTLLIFFNSLRELGTTISLFQSDIPSRLGILRRRAGIDWKDVRKLNNSDSILELTSRLKNDEIDGVRGKLKHEYVPEEKNYNVIDVCLASNIIEVGVDISRLGLMAIVGQPKTTAQYIQVSGRVGRTPYKPGLILTIFSASKPRDRSHFEKFRSYHERLYAQVEPTSVTPFSGPALERALHAIIVGYLRQTMPISQLDRPWPIPEDKIAEITAKIKERVACVYPNPQDRDYVLSDVEEEIGRFVDGWRHNEIDKWESKGAEVGLIYRAGSFVEPAVARRSRKTPQSMRNVDMECKGTIAYPIMRDSRG